MDGKLHVLLAILFVAVIASANVDQNSNLKGLTLSFKRLVNFNTQGNAGSASHGSNQNSAFKQYETNYQGRSSGSVPNAENNGQGLSAVYPFPSFPTPNSDFTCNALLDPQYPIFSDMCGAVPQARYSLPNTFGHNDRWQLAHILTTLMGSATDPTCIRSLRHLLCPMLFQPCQVRHEPPLVLPCQLYCRAVKSQCGIPALDVIPCEVLPYASDLCPNLPIANPLAPPQSAAASNQQQPPTADPSQTARYYMPYAMKTAPQQPAQMLEQPAQIVQQPTPSPQQPAPSPQQPAPSPQKPATSPQQPAQSQSVPTNPALPQPVQPNIVYNRVPYQTLGAQQMTGQYPYYPHMSQYQLPAKNIPAYAPIK